MKMIKRNQVLLITLALSVAGCGESDLTDLEQTELDAAERSESLINAGDVAELVESPAAGSAQPGVDLSRYNLVFSDEFNDSSLDTSKWNTAYAWGTDLVINDELQYYVDVNNDPDFGYSPFSFDGETITISAIETPAELSTVANNQAYLSGVITTADKFDMTFGYIEARMSFPVGTGLWPAFWMLSSEFVDLKPQLFIAEADGSKPGSIFHNYNYHDADGNLRSPGQWQVESSDFIDGFQTLAVSWEPDELLFFINGEARYRVIGENVSKQAMYLLMNLAVGGIWVGSPDSTVTFPAELKVDYVRAYQKSGS